MEFSVNAQLQAEKKRWIQIREPKETQKDPSSEAQRWIHLSFPQQRRRKLALDPSFFPQNGQTRWRWIHGSYPTRPSHTKTMEFSVNAQLPSRYSHTETIQIIINTELRPR